MTIFNMLLLGMLIVYQSDDAAAVIKNPPVQKQFTTIVSIKTTFIGVLLTL